MNKNLKTVAIASAIGVGAGVIATALYYTKATHIFKDATWTPQGDVILRFYHRTNGILIPKPE